MAAQRLHMGGHEAAYACSEAAFGCRGVAFGCTGAIYGSHAADMHYMLHLTGLGWTARILGVCPDGGSQGGLGPLIHHQDEGSRIKDEPSQGSRMKNAPRLEATDGKTVK